MQKTKSNAGNVLYLSFNLGLIIKGFDGLLEIIGGLLLIYLNPDRMSRLIALLTQNELSEDPKDFVANAVIGFSHSYSISTQTFGILYLLSHGLIKCILIILLFNKKLWAYPLTIVSLLLFSVYQIYKYAIQPSLFLLLLTVFDAIMIFLTYKEYQRIKQSREIK